MAFESSFMAFESSRVGTTGWAWGNQGETTPLCHCFLPDSWRRVVRIRPKQSQPPLLKHNVEGHTLETTLISCKLNPKDPKVAT